MNLLGAMATLGYIVERATLSPSAFPAFDEFEGLIAAIHRLNQKDLPILLFSAGLPKIAKLAGDVKSYAERLFEFIPNGEQLNL